MKYLILLNSDKYSYHKAFCGQFRSALSRIDSRADRGDKVCEIDFATKGPLHEKYYSIEKEAPDIIINLDFVGFDLMTEGDNISLNGIPCRIANILFQNPGIYGNYLKYRQNLSMFTYFPKRAADEAFMNEVKEKYPQIPNPEVFCTYDYKASDNPEISMNTENLKYWIPKMLEEVHL